MANYCIKCGTRLDAGTRFCPNCGAPVPEDKHEIKASENRKGDPAAGVSAPRIEPVKIEKGRTQRLKAAEPVKQERKKSKGLFKKILIGYLALTVGYMG
ncbi:MAG: zinc-ribbon domain-containing protein, partial [Solobacterium sp.]|nr:zinc-ribbon domain-containing protein [Solobacterium sp.]